MKWLDRALVRAPYFRLCLSEKDFHRELRRLGIEKKDWPEYVTSATAGATCHTFDTPMPHPKVVCMVCLAEYAGTRDGVEIAGLLVHEAVHIWQKVREEIGERFPSSEFEAYAVQNIAQNLMESYAEQTKPRRGGRR